jgi:tetratricopeptide (TPR) repeat protein
MPETPSLDPARKAALLSTADGPLAGAHGVGRLCPPTDGSNPSTRYLLGEEIARGGMGVVYRATDTVLSREVAVKVLHEKYAPDSGTARRFADEARITGQLQHPNIPAVHDLGVLPDGRPFLAMKLIKGETLEDLLKRRAAPAEDCGRFVAVFEQVCQAVAYAHAHDVIHRDLKPANVMVGTFGEVQIMDWGLAKVLASAERPRRGDDPEETTAPTAVFSLREGDDLFTQAGSVLGTPAFMPPEQAAGAVDVIDRRSDVFGLGAVLAVVLTGRPPFVADTSESARVKAAQGDVGACLARLDGCGADPDLVALCKCCLAPRSEDRPADASAVAQAVAALRAAADERARRAELDRLKAEGEAREALARAAEQRQRRRLLLTATGIVALVLLVGLSVSLWQMRRALEAEDQANTNAKQARDEANAKTSALAAERQARADETKARQQAFAALRSMTDDVVERKFAQGAVLTDDDRAFLRGVIDQFDAFAAIKGDDADSRAVRAEGRFRVGTMRYRLGELKEAEEDYSRALSIYKQLAAEFPTRPDFRQALARSHGSRGMLLKDTGRLKGAEQDYDQALSIKKQLAAEFPSRPEFRQDLAKSHNNRGILLHNMGRLKEAEQDYDQALSIYKQLAAEFPSRPEFRQELARSHNNRGILLHDTGRFKAAEQDYDQALSIQQQLAAEFPSRPEFRQELARTHDNRGNLLEDTGRLKGAEQDFDQALRIQQQLAAEFPSRPEFRQELASSHNNRGNLLKDTGRLNEAEQDCDQALSIHKQLAAEFPTRPEFRQNLATSHNSRGILRHNTGRLKDAEQDYDQALSIRKQLAAEFPSRPEFRQDQASSHYNRGILLHDTGRLKDAEQDYDQALSIQQQLAAEFPSRPEFRQELARSYNNRGNLLKDTGRLKGAEQDYDQALSIYKQLAADFPTRPEFRQELASSHSSRGILRHNTGRLKEAEQDYDQALSIRKQLAVEFPTRPEFRQELARSYNNRGNLLRATGRLKEAEQDHDQALRIQKQLAAKFPNQPDLQNDLAGTFVNVADLHRQQRDWAGAERLLREGRPHHLAALKVNPQHPTYRQFYRNHLNLLTWVHAGLLEQADAVRTAESRRDLGWNAPADAYDAACFLSRCIPIVAKHDKLNDKQRKETAQFYGDAALRLFREAVSKGYNDVAHMKKDTALDPLRQREDFKKLIAELERKGK